MDRLFLRATALLACVSIAFIGCTPEGDGSDDGVVVIPGGAGGDSPVGVYGITSFSVEEDGCDGPGEAETRWSHFAVVERSGPIGGFAFFVCETEEACSNPTTDSCPNGFSVTDDDACMSWGSGVTTSTEQGWENEIRAWSPGPDSCLLTLNHSTLTGTGAERRVEYRRLGAEVPETGDACASSAFDTHADALTCQAKTVIELGPPAAGGGGGGGAGGAMAPGGGGAMDPGGEGGQMMMPPDVQACEADEFPIASEWATIGEGGYTQYVRLSSDGAVSDILLVEFRVDRGFVMAPGTYDLAEVGGAGDTCQVCVIVLENRNLAQRRHERVYMGYEGQVEVVAPGGANEQLAVNLSAVNLSEVTISQGPNGQAAIDVTPNGRRWCLDGLEFDTVVKPPPAMIGEEVHEFSVQNCATEEMVSVTERAARTQALWIVATAEWCSACRQHIPNVMNTIEMNDRANLDVMFVVGENAQRGQITLNACRRYARDLGAENANDFYIDHDGLRAYAQLFSYLNPYLNAMGGFGLPWNAVLEGGEPPVYRHADGAGTNLNQILNSILN